MLFLKRFMILPDSNIFLYKVMYFHAAKVFLTLSFSEKSEKKSKFVSE